MREELQKKIEQSIHLLKSTCGDNVVELAYSGGKDSDVILQLAKEAGIKYRAIYRNTTIDPKGTVKHVKDMGVEILMPKKNFITLMQENGMPNRQYRFCCKFLKEYKVLDTCIMGVRKDESVSRSKNYSEPTECRIYGSKENHVNAIYPILDWTLQDITEFIMDRGIRLAPLYYDPDGSLHTERRLGCMCCPLASRTNRVREFKKYPNMIKLYLRNAAIYMNNHPDGKTCQSFPDVYALFYHDVMCKYHHQYLQKTNTLFGTTDFKQELETIFNMQLPDF